MAVQVTPSQAQEWARLISALVIIAVGVGLMLYAVYTQPELLHRQFDVLFGWFLGVLSGAALMLGLQATRR